LELLRSVKENPNADFKELELEIKRIGIQKDKAIMVLVESTFDQDVIKQMNQKCPMLLQVHSL
jgi:hypothetical protein